MVGSGHLYLGQTDTHRPSSWSVSCHELYFCNRKTNKIIVQLGSTNAESPQSTLMSYSRFLWYKKMMPVGWRSPDHRAPGPPPAETGANLHYGTTKGGGGISNLTGLFDDIDGRPGQRKRYQSKELQQHFLCTWKHETYCSVSVMGVSVILLRCLNPCFNYANQRFIHATMCLWCLLKYGKAWVRLLTKKWVCNPEHQSKLLHRSVFNSV